MIAIAVTAGDQHVGIHAAAHFGHPGIVSRSYPGAAHATDIVAREILYGMLQPAGNRTGIIVNKGYGPACNLRILLDGKGFGFAKPTSAGKIIGIIAVGDAVTLSTGLKPATPGQGVELQLTLKYARSNNDAKEQEVGPFQAFLGVHRLDEVKPVSIHIGSFEYIGPGGMHTQDAVVVRPTYGASDQAPAVTSVMDDAVKRLLSSQ